jgi:hypothetical protein
MSTTRKALIKGLVLAVAFWAVLGTMFMPLFGGESAFKASDKLFNSISKGSTHYIPKLEELTAEYEDKAVDLTLALDTEIVDDARVLLQTAGLAVNATDGGLELRGTLGRLFSAALEDADAMFYNKGEEIRDKYDIEERRVLFTWWSVMAAAERAFNKLGGKESFAVATVCAEVNARGVEVGYNYYGVEPESVKSKAGILIFALVFYVVYTLWWGYAIFFLAEGVGLQLSGGRKKEM